MKEMSPEDKQRIEEAQDKAAREWNSAFDYRALRNGVQVGNIKMHYLDEVNKRAMEIYGERMTELLKEERNKAIDECIAEMKRFCIALYSNGFTATPEEISRSLESLKSQSDG